MNSVVTPPWKKIVLKSTSQFVIPAFEVSKNINKPVRWIIVILVHNNGCNTVTGLAGVWPMNSCSDITVTTRSNCFSERQNINCFISLHILLYNKGFASGTTISFVSTNNLWTSLQVSYWTRFQEPTLLPLLPGFCNFVCKRVFDKYAECVRVLFPYDVKNNMTSARNLCLSFSHS